MEKEIARLEQQNIDLKKQNDAQGRLLIAYSHEKQNKEKQEVAKTKDDKQTNKGEDLLYTKCDPWPAGGMQNKDALLVPGHPKPQPQIALQVHDHDRNRLIADVVVLYASHVRELEAKGETVIVSNTNRVDKVLVHDWGAGVMAEFGRDTINIQITKAKTLEDVRWLGGMIIA